MSASRLALTGLLALVAAAQAAASTSPAAWEQAFGAARPALHLTATYPDAQGKPQVLEFWRSASGQVVRRTGGRAELRLTPAADGEDQYQLLNLQSRTAFDVHRLNLYRVGVFTDRWSVQHLLDRPVGAYTLSKVASAPADGLPATGFPVAGACEWWQVRSAGKVSEVCWSKQYGVPLALRSGGRTVMSVTHIGALAAFPSAALPKDWQEYDADEDLAPD